MQSNKSQVTDKEALARSLYEAVAGSLAKRSRHSLARAVNATGVLLHTGLGRAPLPRSAREALIEAAERYSLLAVDLDNGTRGDRMAHIVPLLKELTGAESALIVNNNAAAVLLVLNTLASGKEAIISRGELVEIDGMFRIPDVMRRAGVTMVEVGTTNRTHLDDYSNALTDSTGLLVKVHPSNFRVEGFHKEVSLQELVEVGSRQSLPLYHDLGSGALVDLRRWNLPYEPTVVESIKSGVDIISFSGDKLIGGPQCGIIVGKESLITRCKKNPLMRAFRPDKLTLAALSGTLKLFREPQRLPETHPLYAMLASDPAMLRTRAVRLRRKLQAVVEGNGELRVIDGFSVMGSGSLPAKPMPTSLVTLQLKNISAGDLGRALRRATVPVFTRIEEDWIVFDVRTIADDEFNIIGRMLKEVIGAITHPIR